MTELRFQSFVTSLFITRTIIQYQIKTYRIYHKRMHFYEECHETAQLRPQKSLMTELRFQSFVTKQGYMKNGYSTIMKVFIVYITCYTVLHMGPNVAVGSFCQQPPSPDLNLTHTHSVTMCTVSHTASPRGITCS